MLELAFTPQPYPLYALTLVKYDEPARFEPTSPAVRLVVGWMPVDGDTLARPVLADHGLIVWDGIVSYHPNQPDAAAMGEQFAKASRREVRSHDIGELFAKFTARLTPH